MFSRADSKRFTEVQEGCEKGLLLPGKIMRHAEPGTAKQCIFCPLSCCLQLLHRYLGLHMSHACKMTMQPTHRLALLQMFYDDLPIWGFIGKVEKILRSGEKPDLKLFLFTHIHFEVMYNGNRIVEINISANPDSTVDITEGENIIVDFTYSVKWKETQTPYERRMDKYSKYSFLPQHLEVGQVPQPPSCQLSL